jgi:LuxR family maltose regulon positive regulatory protein
MSNVLERDILSAIIATCVISYYYYDAGNLVRCVSAAENILHLSHPKAAYATNYLYFHLGQSYLELGQPQKALQYYETAKNISDRYFGPEDSHACVAQALSAEISLERNEITRANEIVESVFGKIEDVHGWFFIHESFYYTAVISSLALRGLPEALAILNVGEEKARERGRTRLEHFLLVLKIHILACDGRVAEATRLARGSAFQALLRAPTRVQDGESRLRAPAMLAAAKLALADEDYPRTLELAGPLSTLWETQGHVRTAIKALVYCGLAKFLMRDTEAALMDIEVALGLSASAKFMHIFVAEGAAMRRVLNCLTAKRTIGAEKRAFIDLVLASMAQVELRKYRPSTQQAARMRILSRMQVAVLHRLGLGFTSKEIARELGLSINTVMGYRKEIYRKLGVRTRSAAVRIAIGQRLVEL